jgi:hypothetical protein
MKFFFLQGMLDRGYPLHCLKRWFAEVDHSCHVRLLVKPRKRNCLADQPPVLVLSIGQFEMTNARIAAMLNRVLHESWVATHNCADLMRPLRVKTSRLKLHMKEEIHVCKQGCMTETNVLSPCALMSYLLQ